MNSIFNSLQPDKQERIINAAIKEFVQSGFDKASTNEIVKEAQISKGSLFNYFTSKKDLYLFLIEHCTQLLERTFERIDLNETDLFKRIEMIGLEKIQIQQQFPYVFDFLATSVQEESAEVKDAIKQSVDAVYEKGMKKLYEHIDYSKFREGVDIQKAIEILNWTISGFGEKATSKLHTFENIGEEYLKEWESYSEILRYSFYK